MCVAGFNKKITSKYKNCFVQADFKSTIKYPIIILQINIVIILIN